VRELSELGNVNNLTGGKYWFENRVKKKGQYGAYVQQLKKESAHVIPGAPYVIYEKDSLGGWERSIDVPTVQYSFHRFFRFHPSHVAMANDILEKLPVSFFGVHLRLESDWETHDISPSFINLLLKFNATRYTFVFFFLFVLLLVFLCQWRKSTM
jgi:hypothetical protein